MTDQQQMTITDCANALRTKCRDLELTARGLKEHDVFMGEQAYPGQLGEMMTNVRLVVRNLEDARMRLGKVCQYAGDGASIYDKV